jgi:hypothetical protein
LIDLLASLPSFAFSKLSVKLSFESYGSSKQSMTPSPETYLRRILPAVTGLSP